ncbi:Kinase-interacting protein 1 [Sesamum alatum]|uniref:Kinase-interacting protein 1 n=1 Tax=Sesamum alatum TaxID=300844 RepID=A0AAE2CCF7_9LAMI|nr:Kinase-interacting protein 1 [Sesamum alatum]
MEEKVQGILKLIDEDGDSFAKRAEMYYKRRPELISNVEEVYKAFRAMGDRYDLLSKELQNANHTIATVFPEQVQFEMGEDEYCPTPKIPEKPQIPELNMLNVPQVPKAPSKDLQRIMSAASKQFHRRKPSKAENWIKAADEKSGLTKDETLQEINKLQKEILALQTVKEFVKSSYESGVAKYWEIENQIMDMQKRVSRLQDEFNMGSVIEDDEARTLMAEAALKTCQETLAMLMEKQEKSTREAREEYKRIEEASQRVQSLRQKYQRERLGEEEPSERDEKGRKAGGESQSRGRDVDALIRETREIEGFPDNTKERLDLSSLANLTVSQMAEKIDQLVNKVISLETAVSSQTVLVNTLRMETDDLNAQIRHLENENEHLIDDTHNLSSRVKEMEEKLNKIQDLNKNVENHHSSLQSNFAEARSSLDHLSERLSCVKPDDEIEEPDSSPSEDKLPGKHKNHKDVPAQGESASKIEDVEDVKEVDVDVQDSDPSPPKGIRKSVSFFDRKPKEQVPVDPPNDLDKEINWQEMLLSGMEDREKILLKEYTTILRNYKDVKKKLSVMEKKERDSQFDITLQIRELKKAIGKRDEEIQNLRQRLNLVQGDKDVKEDTSQQSTSSEDRSVKPDSGNEDSDANKDANIPITNQDDEIKLVFMDRSPSISKVEEKLRTDIDALLDENLDFWLRFSTTFHQVQKFKNEVHDLQDEISKLKEKRKPDKNFPAQIKSEVRPIYKHLREIQTALHLWLDQSMSLKDELKQRFASLCSIQEAITKALKEGVEEDEIRFSSHQAAKFQGEILNMKHENNKVREELQAGLDHVHKLELEVEETLKELNNEFGISSDQQDSLNRPRIPLRSFIFGTKKKQKHSIFSCMHPYKRYHVPKTAPRIADH